MSITQSKSYDKVINECFDVAKQVLEKFGCKIIRQREFAWLIQATKTVNGRDYLINITCKNFQKTQITISCLGPMDIPDEVEKELIESILELLDQLLLPLS